MTEEDEIIDQIDHEAVQFLFKIVAETIAEHGLEKARGAFLDRFYEDGELISVWTRTGVLYDLAVLGLFECYLEGLSGGLEATLEAKR